MLTGKTVCFTGHRPQNLPFGDDERREEGAALKQQLRETIERLVSDENAIHFISGMALGIDLICAELVLELKKKYPAVTLECALPCKGQTKGWNKSDKARYSRILEGCDKMILLQPEYTGDCMMKRNKYMVDNADIVLAVWNGKPSGTGSTIRYADRQEKKVIRINPDQRCEPLICGSSFTDS